MNKLESYGKFIFCFFSRNGGVSRNHFSSLNCSYNTNDKEINIKKNREIISSFFSNRKIIVPNQIHSNIVKNIIQLHKGTIAASNRLNTKGAQVEVLLPKLS